MKIQAVKIGNTINFTIDGSLRKKRFNNAEKANAFYWAILVAKENPTEENLNHIMLLYSDSYRVAYLNDLEIDDFGNVYLGKFTTPMPKNLIDLFIDYNENGYPTKPIINFWTNLMLNPDKRVRESLFDFIETHGFSITDNGYLVVYKAVYTKTDKFKHFIDAQYNKVRKEWKTNPKRYVVYLDNKTNKYGITKTETYDSWDDSERDISYIGNLNELCLCDIPTTYTDMHTQQMDIRIGEVVRMDRTECDGDPQIECSFGLHVGATKYVEKFADNESHILICLVNPMNVVAVPKYDHSKMRVSEYYPIGLAECGDGKIKATLQPYFENDYSSVETKEYKKMLLLAEQNEAPIKPAMGDTEETRSMSELIDIIRNRLVFVGVNK